jgi:predicted O-methyltransferase YrrM
MNRSFDRFTERARKVLAVAQEEAQRMGHDYIGTEHLLLGLIREGDGVAAKVLSNLGVDLTKVRSAVESIIGRGDRPTSGEIGLTPRGKKVIELAVDEARRLSHHSIGVEHLLLGLIREGEGIAAGVLESLGVNLEKARSEVIKMLTQTGSVRPPREEGKPEPRLSAYQATLYGAKDDLLQQLPAEAQAQGLPAIHIPDEIGRLLQILIRAAQVHTILEIGTLFGYSAIWMARALPLDGHIISLEAEPTHVQIARQNLQRAGVADRVEVREGRALDTLATLSGHTFDLVFIDADKVSYPRYLDWALRLTHVGSLIVADNVWREGAVVTDDDEEARALAAFNRQVAASPRLLSTILPTRDGRDALTIAFVR